MKSLSILFLYLVDVIGARDRINFWQKRTYHIVWDCTQMPAWPYGCSESVSVSLPSRSAAWLNCFTAWYTVMLYGSTRSPTRNCSLCLAVPCDIDTAAIVSSISSSLLSSSELSSSLSWRYNHGFKVAWSGGQVNILLYNMQDTLTGLTLP